MYLTARTFYKTKKPKDHIIEKLTALILNHLIIAIILCIGFFELDYSSQELLIYS